MPTIGASQDLPRSTFVTVVAWLFIALSGFTTLIGILQNIVINTMFPLDQMQDSLAQAKGHAPVPAFAEFMLGHARAFFLTFLLLSITTLVSSIGLLRRQNWGRMIFICLMVFGIAWNIFAIVMQQMMFSSVPDFPPSAPAELRSQFEIFLKIIVVFSLIFAVGMSVLFGWIIKRLTSPSIRGEFT
jgi:hypothetical protein